MKKVMLLICLLVLISTFNVVSQSGQPVPKETRGGVYDYAVVLKSAEIDSLNTIINNYERQTSNELAVAIINDDQYRYYDENAHVAAVKIFESWEIGKEGVDNGLLVVFYPNPPRDVNIEVGYGLEQYITDAIAGDLLDGAFIPVLQAQGNYEGLRSLLLAIIEKIGVRSAADIAQAVETRRQAEAQKLAQEQAEKERRAEAQRALWEKVKAFGPVAFILSVCALFIFLLGRALARFVKKCQLRSQARSIINDWESKLVNMPRITLPKHGNWPPWAVQKGENCIEQIKALEIGVCQIIAQAKLLMRKDPATALTLFAEVTEKDFQAVNRIFFGISGEIARYESEAPRQVALAQETLAEVVVTRDEIAAQHFVITNMATKLTELGLAVNGLANDAPNAEPKIVYDQAVRLITDLKATQAQLFDLPEQKKKIDKTVADQTLVLAQLRTAQKTTVKDIYVQLSDNYPRSAWQDVADKSRVVEVELNQAEAELATAQDLGSMAKQLFLQSLDHLLSATTAITIAQEAIESLSEKLQAIQDAEKNYHSRIDVTTQAVAAAKVASNKDHAGTTSKSHYQTAQEKYDAMIELTQQPKIDWLAVVVLLDDAAKEAGLACESASASISAHQQSVLIAQVTVQSRQSNSNNRPSGGLSFGGGRSGGAGARRKGF